MEINQQNLVKLIDRLDLYPVGLPDSPEIREFLSLYLSKDELEMASSFPFKEVTAKEMAKKLDWPEEKSLETLNSLAEKGCVYDYTLRDNPDERYWLLTPSVIGFVEFSLMKLRQDMPNKRIAEIWEEYGENHLWKDVFASKTPISRALVSPDVEIPLTSHVVPLSEIEEMIRRNDGGSVQTCYCRQKSDLLGHPCKANAPLESCFTLSRSATDFMVRRGYGRPVNAEEMIKMIRELGKKGLIHITDNIRSKPSFICNCCGCCCGLLAPMTKNKIKRSVSPTSYILKIDEEKCNGCSLCIKKCQVKAISLSESKKASLDKEVCLGCGACIKFCSKKALSFRNREKKPHIPRNETTKYLRIAFEKKKLGRMIYRILKDKMIN